MVEVKEEMDEEDGEDNNHSALRHQEVTPGAPLRQKSTCCSEVLMVSLSDYVGLLEDHVGFKCNEAFLEDSAIRLLKSSFKSKHCTCQPYRYVLLDLDDPTLIVQRFASNVTAIAKEHSYSITIYGVGTKESEEIKANLFRAGVEFIKKPLTVERLRPLLM